MAANLIAASSFVETAYEALVSKQLHISDVSMVKGLITHSLGRSTIKGEWMPETVWIV